MDLGADMALFKFTRNIIAGEPIEVYAAGKQTRDFTYVETWWRPWFGSPPKTPEAKTPEQGPPIGCECRGGRPSGSTTSSPSSRRSRRKALRANCRCSLRPSPGDLGEHTLLKDHGTSASPRAAVRRVRFVAWISRVLWSLIVD